MTRFALVMDDFATADLSVAAGDDIVAIGCGIAILVQL